MESSAEDLDKKWKDDDDQDFPMTEEELRQAKLWVETWKRAGPLLELQREEEVRTCDTSRAIQSLRGCFLDARARFPVDPTSGLVEQQRLFMLARLL